MKNPLNWAFGKGPKPKAETPYARVEEFRIFERPAYRHDIYEFTKELTQYLEKKNIKNILFIDRSARQAWVGVDEYWKEHYPEKRRPSIFFLNPGVFGAELKERIQVTSLFAKALGGEIDVDAIAELTKEEGQEFKETFTKLMRDKDEPLVVFDTCSHTGSTLLPVMSMLNRLGFSKAEVLTATRPDLVSPIKIAKTLDNNVLLHSCYPFGKEYLVDKGDRIVSDAADDGFQHKGIRSRQEIREIIRRQGK